MIQKIKNIIFASAAALLLMVSLTPAMASADSCTDNTANSSQQQCINGNLCAGSNLNLSGTAGTSGTSGCNEQGTNSLSTKIKTILNILSAVIGVVAVIMIIYAGFRYVTSAGSEGGVKSAKNAIIYAVVGLIIVALAQVIVHFVIHTAIS